MVLVSWRRRTIISATCLGMLAGLVLAAPRAEAAGRREAVARASGRRGGPGRGPARGRRGSMAGRRGPIAVVPRSEFEAAYLKWNHSCKRFLLMTSGGAQGGAKRPVSDCREQWYELLRRYHNAPPPEFADDERWQSDLATITGYLHIAEWRLHAGHMKESHEALERVRWIWLGIRERNGVRWFGDELTRYHAVMEPVVKWASGAEHGGVTPENVEDFEVELAKLLEAWRRLAQQRPPQGNMRRYSMGMRMEAHALSELDEIAAVGLYEDIPEAAKAVRSAFTMLFMGFG